MAQRRRSMRQQQIDRRVELEIKRGIESNSYITRIRDIQGTTIKLIAPRSGPRPIEIKAGTPLTIHEKTLGVPASSYKVWAGPDTANPERPHQYQEQPEEEGEEGDWILLVQQDDDMPIQRRELFRANVRIPVILKLADSNKRYGNEDEPLRSINLSGSGMLLAVDLDDKSEIPRGMRVILSFQLPDFPHELPTMKGTVVRVYKYGESLKGHAVGIEFDEFEELGMSKKERDEEQERAQNERDQQAIIRYAMRENIKSQADLLAAQEET